MAVDDHLELSGAIYPFSALAEPGTLTAARAELEAQHHPEDRAYMLGLAIARAWVHQMVRCSTRMQLDIFEHSRDVMLRNDVIHALQRRDAAAARTACERLDQECPADESLQTLRALAGGLEVTARSPFGEHLGLRQARQAVEELQPAAHCTFGAEGAMKWLAPLWEDLALRAEALSFRADCAQDHAASLWLRAGNWKAAAQAVTAIESWRRIPAPLAWITLLGLEHQGRQRDIVERRKTLRDLHPSLYAAYMKTR